MVEYKEYEKNQQIIEERSINPKKKVITTTEEANKIQENEDKVLTAVENMMTQEEETRNDDNLLIVEIWQKDLGIDLSELINKIKQVSSASSMMRARRIIQNKEGQLLPTRVSVLRMRKIKREVIEGYYGLDSKIIKEWKEDTFMIK